MNNKYYLLSMIAIFILSLVWSGGAAASPVTALGSANLDHPSGSQVASRQPITLADISSPSGDPLQNITNLSAGGYHTCARTASGGLKCWGDNGHGQLGDGTTITRSLPLDVSGLTSGVIDVSAGLYHTCAVTAGGGVKCWGRNMEGQLGDGTYTDSATPVNVSGLASGVKAVTASGFHTCALTTGNGVKCWGRNYNGELGDGTTNQSSTPVDVSGLASGVSAVTAGLYHTCARTIGGGVKCWGENSDGQLGDGTTTDRHAPVDVSSLTSGISSVTAGGHHTCALTAGNGVKCWGQNAYGQLGDGTTDNSSIAVNVSSLTSGVTAVAAGFWHTCAVSAGLGIKCWGYNQFGQLGDGTTTNRYTPIDVSGLVGGITAVTAGAIHTCALTNTSGEVKCWGSNADGQLGDGTAFQRSIPIDVSSLVNGVIAAAGGGWHTCAVTAGGGAKCWGDNRFGQLGDGTRTDSSLPLNVSGLTGGVSDAAAGWYHTCVLLAGGVKCWGLNMSGQLGDGTTTDNNTPVNVGGLTSGVSSVMAGGHHTCALTAGNGVKCWGDNGYGQLGDGTLDNSSTPVNVIGLGGGVTAVTTGAYHTCALTAGGGVKCWGWNMSGQLGDGTMTDSNTPVNVSGLASGVGFVGAGANHTCAVTTGGLKCWGYNNYGQLGDGTTNDSSSPVDVIGLAGGVTALAAGNTHTCALTTGNGVKCWGDNHFGQLGDGTTDSSNTPVNVSGLTSGASAVTAGYWHTCALASGRLKCWGSDDDGQLGLGTILQRLTPVTVVGSVPPSLSLNYLDGQPGSFFTLTGANYPPGALATVTINGAILTTSQLVNETGGFITFFDTASADPGYYVVTVSANQSATATFLLDSHSPARVQEGGGDVIQLPAGIAVEPKLVYLALINTK